MDITIYTKGKHSRTEKTYTNVMTTALSLHGEVATLQLFSGEGRIAEVILSDNVHIRAMDTVDMYG